MSHIEWQNRFGIVVILFLIGFGVAVSAYAAVQSIDQLPYLNPDECRPHDRRPAEKVICDFGHETIKKTGKVDGESFAARLAQENMYVTGLYYRALQNTALNSPEQQRIVREQGAYLDRRDACGRDVHCIMRIEKARHQELITLTRSLEKTLPDDEIAIWTHGRVFPGRDGKAQSLGQRVMAGFDLYPLPHVTFADGSTLFWGFLHGDGAAQSLAITDATGHLQLLGTADGLLLAGTGGGKLQQAQLNLFVRDAKTLGRYLPAVRAWAAASVLGFNQACPGKDQARCQRAMKLPLPIRAYNLHCQAGSGEVINQHCAVPLPKVPDSVSPGLFWQ